MRRSPLVLSWIALFGCDSTPAPQGPEAAPLPAPPPAASTAPTTSAGSAAAPASSSPPADASRDARIRQRFGERCRLERACGELWGIDCEAAVDGPYYYVKPSTLEIVSRCGGFCMGGRCTNCPPREWKCATY
jgi:hypothetical protein